MARKTTARKPAPKVARPTKTKPAKGYLDTMGEELDEALEGTSPAKQLKLDKANLARIKGEQKAKARHYQGKVEATRVFRREMEEFKNCTAYAWMILREDIGTVCYANSYGAKGSDLTMPRSSWDPATYTYPIKEKVIAKKMNEYVELEEREEWPEWIVPAAVATKKARKGK